MLGRNICAYQFTLKLRHVQISRNIFLLGKQKRGTKIFPRLTITVGLAIYVQSTRICVCAGLKHFFYDHPMVRMAGINFDESRVFARRVTCESHSVLEIQGKGWAKAMVAGKCDEAKIKSTRGTNKMGRKEMEGLIAGRTFRRASRLHNISSRRFGVWLKKRSMSLDLTLK